VVCVCGGGGSRYETGHGCLQANPHPIRSPAPLQASNPSLLPRGCRRHVRGKKRRRAMMGGEVHGVRHHGPCSPTPPPPGRVVRLGRALPSAPAAALCVSAAAVPAAPQCQCELPVWSRRLPAPTTNGDVYEECTVIGPRMQHGKGHNSLVLLGTQLEVLGALQGQLELLLAILALQTQHDLLGGLCLQGSAVAQTRVERQAA
jgi:hypothetical protein